MECTDCFGTGLRKANILVRDKFMRDYIRTLNDRDYTQAEKRELIKEMVFKKQAERLADLEAAEKLDA